MSLGEIVDDVRDKARFDCTNTPPRTVTCTPHFVTALIIVPDDIQTILLSLYLFLSLPEYV
jgi:hypothetical protein